MKKGMILLALLLSATLAITASCLNRNDPLGEAPVITGSLLVDSGYTPSDSTIREGEYSSFTLRWTPSEDAAYCVIKHFPAPITLGNWDDILVADTVQGDASSAYVFVQPDVFQNTCIGCGLCTQVCPHNAITLQDNGKAVIDQEICMACGECIRVCPVDAIRDSQFGQAYYFGIRAYSETGMASEHIATSSISHKLIYFNDKLWCGHCTGNLPSGGTHSGCYMINTNTEPDESGAPTGPGCPVGALWQDTEDYMIYIDYDKCINCGQCFLECWNYGGVIDPAYGYHGLWSMRKTVVPGGFTPNVPVPPSAR